MKDMPQIAISYPNFLDWRERTRAFEAMALFNPYQSYTVTGAGGAERVPGALTTANLCDVIGLHPTIGRAVRAEDDRPGAERVALVSDAFWRRRLGAAPALDTLSLFLDEDPTYGYLPSVYYYQGRVREAIKTAGFAESYRAYLNIRGNSTEDPLLADVRKRAGL